MTKVEETKQETNLEKILDRVKHEIVESSEWWSIWGRSFVITVAFIIVNYMWPTHSLEDYGPVMLIGDIVNVGMYISMGVLSVFTIVNVAILIVGVSKNVHVTIK